MPDVSKRRLNAPSTIDWNRINWIYVVPFVVIHVLACLVFVPWLFSWAGVAAFVVGLYISGKIGIPICYHRQLTHRSFKTAKWLEHVFVFFALCSLQETPVAWVAWHRKHHNDSDHPEDPHSPLVNFIWSHIGWLCFANRQLETLAFKEKYARDLLKDPWYRMLEKYSWSSGAYYLAHAVVIFLASYGIGWAVFQSQTPALQLACSILVWGVIARTVYVWHITWSVNSLSHIWGYRSYETSDDSRNNWFVALLTGGEGWHNNHHYDQAAATVQFRWWEWDSNYYFIRALEIVGLATDVIRPREIREAERAERTGDAADAPVNLSEDETSEPVAAVNGSVAGEGVES